VLFPKLSQTTVDSRPVRRNPGRHRRPLTGQRAMVVVSRNRDGVIPGAVGGSNYSLAPWRSP
jgi:hypothetical protein